MVASAGELLVTAAVSTRLKTVTSGDGVALPSEASLVGVCCWYSWLGSELGRADEIQHIVKRKRLYISSPLPPLSILELSAGHMLYQA